MDSKLFLCSQGDPFERKLKFFQFSNDLDHNAEHAGPHRHHLMHIVSQKPIQLLDIFEQNFELEGQKLILINASIFFDRIHLLNQNGDGFLLALHFDLPLQFFRFDLAFHLPAELNQIIQGFD